MARVPIFEGGQRRAPLHQSNFTVRARPEAFGAAAGRGLVALGQGVGDVGEAITTVADLRAQNALKNAQADYMEGARALASDPDTGFLSRTGSAALGSRAGVEQLLNELGQRTAETLPRRVHAQFRDFRTRHDVSILGEYLKHEAQQTKVQTQAASQRRVSTLRQEAVRNHTDPVAHLASLQEAETEFRTMAGWNGLSGEATEQMLAQHRDNVQSDIILQKAEADPLAAEVYYDTIKDSLQDETRQQIDKILNPTLTIARAEATAEEITVGLSATGSGNIVQVTADSLVDSVEKNASLLAGTANNDTLAGSAGNDNLTAPDDAAVAPDPERAQRVEQVRRNVRQRSDLNAIRLARAGVMLSPGNLLLSTILGAPLAIAVNRADLATPVSSLLADTLGLASDAPLRAELDSELGEATTGDLNAEFSKGAASHVGSVDVEASISGVADPEERSLVRNQITAALTTQDRQRREAATARVQGAFAAIKEGGSLSGLSLEDKAELDGELRQAAIEYQQALAAGGDPKTDFSLAHTLARQFAQDPDGFAGVNIFKHRARFSDAAFGVLESWHELARNGSDEADERAAEISSLIGEAGTFLTEAGLDLGNLHEEDGNKASRFLFRFLTDAYAFRLANGHLPNTEEKLDIARQLRPLMPEVRAEVEASEEDVGAVPADGEGDVEPRQPEYDIRTTQTWRNTFVRLVEQHGGDELAAGEELDRILLAIQTKPVEALSPQEQDVVVRARLERLNFPDADAEDLSSVYRNWEPWKQRYQYFLDQNGGKHDEAVAMADLAVEEAIRINTENAGLPAGELSDTQFRFVQQIRLQMNGEDAAVFRKNPPLVRPQPEQERVPVPGPKGQKLPEFRHRQPWKNLHAQLLPYFDGNDTIATIVADAMISAAENRKPEEFTLGGMTPEQRAVADQVRFNRFGGPEDVHGPGLELLEKPFDWGLLGLVVDFLPIIGDAKAFAEAEDAVDVGIAAFGLVPLGGDFVAKILKGLKKVFKKTPTPDLPNGSGQSIDVLDGSDVPARDIEFDTQRPEASGPIASDGGPLRDDFWPIARIDDYQEGRIKTDVPLEDIPKIGDAVDVEALTAHFVDVAVNKLKITNGKLTVLFKDDGSVAFLGLNKTGAYKDVRLNGLNPRRIMDQKLQKQHIDIGNRMKKENRDRISRGEPPLYNCFTGSCAELEAISKALYAGFDLNEMTIFTIELGNGSPKGGIEKSKITRGTKSPPCDTCAELLGELGLKVAR